MHFDAYFHSIIVMFFTLLVFFLVFLIFCRSNLGPALRKALNQYEKQNSSDARY